MAVPAVSASDLAFIQAHTIGVVKARKPRLMSHKQNLKRAMPVCTVAPAVTGTPTVGQTLTCSTGTWLNSPTFTYSWRRKGAAITGATAATYVLQAVDSGYVVECEVTATNGAGAVATRSNTVAVA